MVRSLATAVVVLTVYGLAPLKRDLDAGTWLLLLALGAGLLLVMIVQLRAVYRSPNPRLRTAQALMLVLPLFLVLFAATYVVLANGDPDSFSEPLDHVDALYFTVTTFATVGFGDISPVTQLARILVTVQMVAGLLAVGLVAKGFLDVARVAEAGRRDLGG